MSAGKFGKVSNSKTEEELSDAQIQTGQWIRNLRPHPSGVGPPSWQSYCSVRGKWNIYSTRPPGQLSREAPAVSIRHQSQTVTLLVVSTGGQTWKQNKVCWNFFKNNAVDKRKQLNKWNNWTQFQSSWNLMSQTSDHISEKTQKCLKIHSWSGIKNTWLPEGQCLCGTTSNSSVWFHHSCNSPEMCIDRH